MRDRRFVLTCTAILGVLLSVSCTKKGAPTTEIQSAIELSGVVAWQGAPFYLDAGASGSQKAEWKAALDFGLKVKKTSKDKPRSLQVGGQPLELIPVEIASPESVTGLDAKGPVTGWMQPAHFAGGGAEPAVVTGGRVSLLSGPSAGAGAITALPRASLVAIVRQTDQPDFARAIVLDPVGKSPYANAYVDSRQLSVSRIDVQAGVFIAKALAARSPEEKKAILEEAERSFPSTTLIEDIRTLLGGGKKAAEGPAVEPLAVTLTAKSDEARIRKAPDFDAEVVAELKMDDEVRTVSRTVQAFENKGKSAHWYAVQSPVDGWVFGLDLEGAD